MCVQCSRSAEKCRGLEYRVGECQRELEAAREECRRELEAAREECRRELEAARETALSKEESITLLKYAHLHYVVYIHAQSTCSMSGPVITIQVV